MKDIWTVVETRSTGKRGVMKKGLRVMDKCECLMARSKLAIARRTNE